jgi:hypothetical protein
LSGRAFRVEPLPGLVRNNGNDITEKVMRAVERRPVMRASIIILAASGAALGTILAPAGPAAAESAVVTIGQLQAEGFNVTIDRIGSAPLEQCTVTSVRNPQTETRLVRVERFGRNGKDFDLVPIVVRRTITVSLDCAN